MRDTTTSTTRPKTQTNLSFARLSELNAQRCEDVFHPVHDWSPTDWACAMGGEAGEVLNVVKKIRRGDFTEDQYREHLAKELADVVIYADLLATRMGISLGDAVRDKFNEVSAKRGSCVWIIDPPPMHAHDVDRSDTSDPR